MLLCGHSASECNGFTKDQEHTALVGTELHLHFVLWKVGGGSRSYPVFPPFGDNFLPEP